VFLEPVGILDPFISGLVRDDELAARISEFLDQFDGVLDSLALNDPRGLQDKDIIRQTRSSCDRRFLIPEPICWPPL